MVKVILLVSVLLLALFVRDGQSIRCWNCSSAQNPACNDTFGNGTIDNLMTFNVIECDGFNRARFYYPSLNSMCIKQKKYVDGQLVTLRGCTLKHEDDRTTACLNEEHNPDEVTTFCETCDEDGCNGATTHCKAFAFIIAPLAILLFK